MSSTPSDLLSRQVEAFLERLIAERRGSAKTAETYGRDLRALHAFVIEQGLPARADALDILTLRRFLASFVGRNGGATTARKIAALRGFLRDLQRRGEVRDNAAAMLRLPKVRKPLPRFLTVQTAGEVVEGDPMRRDLSLALRDRAMLELLYGSGVRVSGLVGLDLMQLDLGARMARVVGKGDKERVVPFGQPCAEALRTYLAVRGRREALETAAHREGCFSPRRTHRQPGSRGSAGGPQGHLLFRLVGGRRRQ
jgi:integrase/recombinase XerC